MQSEFLNVDLIKELGLDKEPKEKREALISQMTEVVENRLNRRVLALLSESEKKELDTLLDEDGDLLAFLQRKIPDLDLITSEIISDFKREMLELQNTATQAWNAAKANFPKHAPRKGP